MTKWQDYEEKNSNLSENDELVCNEGGIVKRIKAFLFKGEKGDKGDKGDKGIQGMQGIQGIEGKIGPIGPQGEQGIKGDTGNTGPQGIQGIQGDKGEVGPTGPQGPQGEQGIQGEVGPVGPQGVMGPAGPGNGDMLADNNLSDLENKETARINLGVSSTSEINTALTLKSNISDIQDVLTSTDTNKPLSANQGKVLKGLIDNLIAVVDSSDTALDTLQEIVDYIKVNRTDLQNLSIGAIAGLQSALDGKANSSHTHSYNDLNNKPTIPPKVGVNKSGNLDVGDHRAIALGDGDTGLRQDGDGRLQAFVNNSILWHGDKTKYIVYKPTLANYSQPSDNNSLVRKDYVDGNMDNKKLKAITQSNYDGLATKDVNTLYFITE